MGRVSLTMPEDLEAWAREFAQVQDRNLTSLINHAVRQYLKRYAPRTEPLPQTHELGNLRSLHHLGEESVTGPPRGSEEES